MRDKATDNENSARVYTGATQKYFHTSSFDWVTEKSELTCLST